MNRMTGGLAVLYQVAARLRECGLPVALTAADNTPGLTAAVGRGFEVLPWEVVTDKSLASPLKETDWFLVAEGWPNMMAPAFNAGSRVLVYVQNWAYVFSALPPAASWHNLPVSFLAVSDPVARFVRDMAGLPLAGIVRPALDGALYRPAQQQSSKVVRIGWMPRKNKALAGQIRQIADGMDGKNDGRAQWVEIHGMTPAEVGQALGSCHIFLATGFPEGFSLPPLEAMASGCAVVGFTGFGGWDYMRQADGGTYAPRFTPRPVPWNGNGLFAADGDVLEASHLLREAVAMVRENSSRYAAIREQGLKTAAAYSIEAQREEIRAIWGSLPA